MAGQRTEVLSQLCCFHLLLHLLILVVKIISRPLASSFLMYESGHYGAPKHKITLLKVYFSAYLSFNRHTILAGVQQQDAVGVPFGDLDALTSGFVFVLFGGGGGGWKQTPQDTIGDVCFCSLNT